MMSRSVDPALGRIAAAETLPENSNSFIFPDLGVAATHSEEMTENTFWRKDVGSTSSTPRTEAQRLPSLPLDSLEDILVEKWVDDSSDLVAGDIAPRHVFRNERATAIRFSPLAPRSRENRTSRPSVSYTTVLPYKRDVPRKTLVRLRYRHYHPKSIRGAELRYQNPKGLAYAPASEEPSAVRSGPFFSCALDKRAARFDYDRAFDRDSSPFEQEAPQAQALHDSLLEECLRGCRGTGAFADIDGGSILDELDLEWTRERLAQASVRDEYDSDMTDQ